MSSYLHCTSHAADLLLQLYLDDNFLHKFYLTTQDISDEFMWNMFSKFAISMSPTIILRE